MPQNGLLPHRFLFRYSFPVRYEQKIPRAGKKMLGLGIEYQLADLAQLDAANVFGKLALAWNERGLGISLAVEGKSDLPIADPLAPESSDGLRLFIDTRDTHNIHRASRYCQQFFIFPAGQGKQRGEPFIVQVPIARAREEAPVADLTGVKLTATHSKTGYRIEAWLPASALYGYDPEAQPRLGFYYSLRDRELGEQHLGVGQDFPYAIDPSLWSTLELNSPS